MQQNNNLFSIRSDEAWKKFEHSGVIEDYLTYRTLLQHEGILSNVDQNQGDRTGKSQHW